jgi:hypothetical protein
MTWRSLGDSNPCFRRERDAEASIAVHTRFVKRLNGLTNRPYLCMLALGRSRPLIGHLLDTKHGAQNSRRKA